MSDAVRLSTEWEAVVSALGPHAHPGLSPSESVAEVVNLVRVQDEANREMTRLLAEAEAEREALRVELGEMALVLEQQTRTLTREHEQRERAEAAEPRCVRCGSRYSPGGACSRRAEGCQGGRGEWITFFPPAEEPKP